MGKNMRYTLLNIVLLFFASAASGQEILTDRIDDPRIRTVQLYREGWNLSNPVIQQGKGEKLVLHFDLLGDHDEALSYRFTHCDKDWRKSDIFETDYAEGFPENPVEHIRPSFNTTVKYTHYSIVFPNDKINLRLSGNYIISVFSPDNPEKILITRRFVVSEQSAGITMSFNRPGMMAERDAAQQVEFTVQLKGTDIIDPQRNIYSSLLQNGRWDNAKSNLKPAIYGGNELKYNTLTEGNIFNGGNEFRQFDIRSIKQLSENVRRIDFVPPCYNVALAPSESREFKPYFYSQDFNGKYYVATKEGRDPDTDADYVYVYFSLAASTPITSGSVHVLGALSDWSYGKENMMTFNNEQGRYECTMLLKQGWYNFVYSFAGKGGKKEASALFEGSHYETENDYTVIVYYRNPRDRYDRVLGTFTANTLNRISY
ncbi:MAG: DUF5103 domain-containing protein [Bacteroidales bacterium]|nr:DUF5103 domain-containing protein [Bacteroidales bacterium]